MYWIWLLLALVAGVIIAVQVGINAELRVAVGDPVVAVLLSSVIGLLAMAAYAVLTRATWPETSTLLRVPGWQWLGGVLGAAYLVTTVILAPRLGAATLVGLVVTGQLLASLALDHFGVLGFPRHTLGLWRALGTALLIAGVALIQST